MINIQVSKEIYNNSAASKMFTQQNSLQKTEMEEEQAEGKELILETSLLMFFVQDWLLLLLFWTF